MLPKHLAHCLFRFAPQPKSQASPSIATKSRCTTTPTTVELTEEQWQRINTDFPVMLSEVVTLTLVDAAGMVYS